MIVPLLEAVIITVTATILGLVMAAGAVLVLAIGLPVAGMTYAFIPPTAMFAATVTVTLAITVTPTVLPTLHALPEVEPMLIGRLIAD